MQHSRQCATRKGAWRPDDSILAQFASGFLYPTRLGLTSANGGKHLRIPFSHFLRICNVDKPGTLRSCVPSSARPGGTLPPSRSASVLFLLRVWLKLLSVIMSHILTAKQEHSAMSKMKICPHCHKEIFADTYWCGYCGKHTESKKDSLHWIPISLGILLLVGASLVGYFFGLFYAIMAFWGVIGLVIADIISGNLRGMRLGGGPLLILTFAIAAIPIWITCWIIENLFGITITY